MAVLQVEKYGSPILRKIAKPVTDFSDLDLLVNNLSETMIEQEGIGLSANQIGVDKAVFVIFLGHIDESSEEQVKMYVNPKIIDKNGLCEFEEGCLSIPDIRATITRAEEIYVEYETIDKIKYKEHLTGLLARVFQHEYDHLNGKYFTDYLSTTKRSILKKRFVEITKNGKPSKSVTL